MTCRWGYATMLAVATVISTAIALLGGWGHTGGWLIMTPIIVIQPMLHDAWAKSLRRAAGTVGGFLIASFIGLVVPIPAVEYALGIIFAAAVIYAMESKWNYATYSLLITVAIVLLEGTNTSVPHTALLRIVATLTGVGIALGMIGLATPVYRRQNRRTPTTTS